MSLANESRPKRFADVVGQEPEVQVIKRMIEKNWQPSAILYSGPFGTGKTTLGRLTARAMLCSSKDDVEPCGICASCQAMDRDNNPDYTELDAASQGSVADVRAMKEFVSFRSTGGVRIVNYDESHMLSTQAQNALLQTLEEGVPGVVFMFCTTDPNKMLPTILSRAIVLRLKLLSASQISSRLRQVAETKGFDIEDTAIKILATYVRGHVRDALMLLEQVVKTVGQGNRVEAEFLRQYLRLDQTDDIYKFLLETEAKAALELLETLLCNYSAAELTEQIGTTLLNAYKVRLGFSNFTEVDAGWLKRVADRFGNSLLEKAEAVLRLDPDFGTIQCATAAMAAILIEADASATSVVKSIQTAVGASAGNTPPVGLRKQRT